jgi:hypothetical protein
MNYWCTKQYESQNHEISERFRTPTPKKKKYWIPLLYFSTKYKCVYIQRKCSGWEIWMEKEEITEPGANFEQGWIDRLPELW